MTNTRRKEPSPPWIALRILLWRVPEPDREYVVGDLLEAFHECVARDGITQARAQFWRETFHLLATRWPASPSMAVNRPEAPMDSIIHTWRSALRSLSRAPSLTALVVLTLALGIGATTSVYSVARAALFAAAPFPNSDRLMLVWERDRDGGENNVGYATYQDLSRESLFAASAAMSYWMPSLSDGRETTRHAGQRVSWTFFDVLGVRPMLGRGFTPDEDQQGANRVVILSHSLWSSRFGSDSSLVGRDIMVNGVAFRVAGVLPPTFESVLAPGAELWAPLGYNESLSWACRTCRHLRMVARLKADASIASVSDLLNTRYSRLREQFPNAYAGPGMVLTSMHEYVVRQTRPAIIALLAAVGLVALIACFNAANLLLGRVLRRESEFALRVTLGASHVRLAAPLIVEGLMLSLVAAGIGSVLAIGGVDILVKLAPPGIPRLDQVRIDGAALGFAVVIALATGLAASVLPALALLRAGLQPGIRGAARSLVGTGRHRLRSMLVAGEVALAVLLVSAATLLLGSVNQLLRVDSGFATDNRVTMELSLSGPRFADSGSVARAWNGVLETVHALPGVSSASLASQIPLGGNYDMYGIHLEDRAGANEAEDPSAQRYAVTSRYFETMGIALRSGRLPTEADVADAPPVMLINELAANTLFPGRSATGRRVRTSANRQYATIIGVVANTVHQGLDGKHDMQMYIPAAQWGEEAGMTLVVHTSTSAGNAIPLVTKAVRNAIPDVAISNVATMDRLIAISTADRRFALALFAGFAGVALTLAAAGLFGVMSATVVERTREIGLRSALGAPRGRILGMVVRQGMVLTGTGLAFGLFASWGSTRILSTLLFGVGTFDPIALLSVVSSLVGVAIVASALPAWRASRVDPLIALRD